MLPPDMPVNFDQSTAGSLPFESRATKPLAALVAFPSAVDTPEPSDDNPVPPFDTPSVPPMVKVPDEVIGPPVTVKPVVPAESATLVTVPLPEPDAP